MSNRHYATQELIDDLINRIQKLEGIVGHLKSEIDYMNGHKLRASPNPLRDAVVAIRDPTPQYRPYSEWTQAEWVKP